MTPEKQILEAAKGAVYDLATGISPAKVRKDLSAAIAALEASPEGDGWLPIESAPKDGTRVQLWRSPWKQASQGYNLDDRSPETEGWFTTGSHIRIEPTHWMPLPNPPVAQPDGIDLPTAPKIDCERCGRSFSALDLAAHIPDCQPVTPSEGEVVAGPRISIAVADDRERVVFEIGDDGAFLDLDAGPAAQETIRRVIAATNPTPEGHVAVYLPVEVAEEITRPVIAANLNGELDHAHQLVEATRQALSNGEGV